MKKAKILFASFIGIIAIFIVGFIFNVEPEISDTNIQDETINIDKMDIYKCINKSDDIPDDDEKIIKEFRSHHKYNEEES